MKYRVVLWALVGVLVVLGWDWYATATFPNPSLTHAPIWSYVQLTCPVVYAASYFHLGMKIYWVILANALTYAIVGFLVEMFRHPVRKLV